MSLVPNKMWTGAELPIRCSLSVLFHKQKGLKIDCNIATTRGSFPWPLTVGRGLRCDFCSGSESLLLCVKVLAESFLIVWC